jgi:hypothetical protein
MLLDVVHLVHLRVVDLEEADLSLRTDPLVLEVHDIL